MASLAYKLYPAGFAGFLAAYVILSHQFGADDTKSLWAIVASVISFWLGKA